MRLEQGWRSVAFDGLIAVAATGIAVSIAISLDQSGELSLASAISLSVVHNLCLVARRVRPVEVLAIQLVSGIAAGFAHLPLEVLGIGLLFGVYTLASRRPLQESLIALSVTLLCVFIVPSLANGEWDLETHVGNSLVLVALWFLGNSVYARREYVKQLESRNEELRKARDELAQAVAVEERLRIARELHDVIAHSMSMIAVQSGVGAHIIDSNPAEAKRSLLTIENASKSALNEIRRFLGILRQENGTPLDSPPTLGEVGRLVELAGANGPEVDLQVRGDLSGLPAGVDLTAYRIVQEALTNVVKHAESARARVVIARSPTELRVEIVDDGRGAQPMTEDGQGLLGMRERVSLYGGVLEAGPLPEGGFRVSALIPLEESE